MLEWFRCPDGEIIPVRDCLECVSSCRCGETCLTQPTRHEIAKEREWTGEPSTTQLLNGTMMEFLKLTQPYIADPDGRVFALLGTRHHTTLEESAKELNLPSEIALTGDDRDIVDLLEPDGDGGYSITDYKTWGSYKVAKALGIVEGGKIPDPSGEVYKRSGVWGSAGSPKMITKFTQDPTEVDNLEAELQLNHYRILFQDKFGLEISKMRIQVTVRDGGLAVATSRGITRNSYMITVPMLEDDYIREYFEEKASDLIQAVEMEEWETPCSNWECWDGVRCRDYCDVWMFCHKGMVEKGGKQ